MAGGYDILHMGSKNSFLLASEVQSEIGAIIIQLAGFALRGARVRAELSNLENMGVPRSADVQVPAATFSALVRTEHELFKTHRAEYMEEKEFLERSIKQTFKSWGD